MQRAVKDTLETLSEAPLAADVCAVDGCSVPTWAMPLDGAGAGVCALRQRRGACRRSAPGPRRGCARPARRIPGTSPAPGGSAPRSWSRFGARIFVKTGAEGVYCAALPELGLGIAVKCDDGAGRAAEVMMAATLDRLLNNDADSAELAGFVRPPLRNWNGIRGRPIAPDRRFPARDSGVNRPMMANNPLCAPLRRTVHLPQSRPM